jgi:hypothetical protein
VSRFEDAVATRKRAERKERQQFLQEQVSACKLASFTVGDAYLLFRFFALADPSDEELMEATSIVENHIAGNAAFWKEFHAEIPPKE